MGQLLILYIFLDKFKCIAYYCISEVVQFKFAEEVIYGLEA